jgi:hypothetical protein
MGTREHPDMMTTGRRFPTSSTRSAIPQNLIATPEHAPLVKRLNAMLEVAQGSGRSVPGFYQWLHRMRRMLLDCIRRALAQEALS